MLAKEVTQIEKYYVDGKLYSFAETRLNASFSTNLHLLFMHHISCPDSSTKWIAPLNPLRVWHPNSVSVSDPVYPGHCWDGGLGIRCWLVFRCKTERCNKKRWALFSGAYVSLWSTARSDFFWLSFEARPCPYPTRHPVPPKSSDRVNACSKISISWTQDLHGEERYYKTGWFSQYVLKLEKNNTVTDLSAWR